MNSVLVYRADEFSFDLIPAPVSAFTSVLVNDLNLEIDEKGKILSVWGLCPHTRWKDALLVPPEAVYGDLLFMTDEPLQRAVSLRLIPDRRHLPTFVDRKQGWVKVECSAGPEAGVTIAPGITFEIGHQGELCAIWLHPQNGIPSLS